MSAFFVLPEYVMNVLNRLLSSGFEAFLVGGCVRDELLGRRVHDFDVATNATPAQVINLFETVFGTGLKHGTVTVLAAHRPVEVTTYRIDGKYTDGRHPDTVEFASSITDDLARRDFTINAMAVDVHGTLIDPFGGRADLRNRIIRAVGHPGTRFREDSLRILRALRFSSELEFRIDESTLTGMYDESCKLRTVSSERIGHELSRTTNSNWWFVAEPLATGDWLENARPSLTLIKEALQRLMKQVDDSQKAAQDWYTAIDSVPVSSPGKRQLGFLVTILTILPDSAKSIISSCSKLGWPKSLLKRAQSAATLAAEDIDMWTTARWRQVLFDNQTSAVELACRISDWMRVHARADRIHVTGICMDAFKQHCLTQPLFDLKDLQISGHDILQLGASGPLIGRIKRQLAQQVLADCIQNDNETLLKRAGTMVKETLADDE